MVRWFRKAPPELSSRDEHSAFISAMDISYMLVWFAPDGTILDVNENFCRLFGYTKDEVVGQSRRILLDENDPQDKDEEAATRGLQTTEPRADVVGRLTKDGKKRWLSATYLPIKDNMGKVIKVVTVSHDVTS